MSEFVCSYPDCTKAIPFPVFRFSLSVFKRPLCIPHQDCVRHEEKYRAVRGQEVRIDSEK